MGVYEIQYTSRDCDAATAESVKVSGQRLDYCYHDVHNSGSLIVQYTGPNDGSSLFRNTFPTEDDCDATSGGTATAVTPGECANADDATLDASVLYCVGSEATCCADQACSGAGAVAVQLATLLLPAVAAVHVIM